MCNVPFLLNVGGLIPHVLARTRLTTIAACAKVLLSFGLDDHIFSRTPSLGLVSSQLLEAFVGRLLPNAAAYPTHKALDYYTLTAVGQDEFEDVKVPDQPRKPSEAK